MLIVSVQRPAAERPLSHVDYFVGELTGTRFHARRRGRLDGGDALYAPAVMTDEHGRHLLWGWVQEALDPAVQRHLPVAGALSLPRQLTLDGDELRVTPVPELAGLRTGTLLMSVPTGTAAHRVPARSARQLVVEAALSGVDGSVELRLADDGGQGDLRVTAVLGGPLEVTVTGPAGDRTHRVTTPPSAEDTLTVYRDGSLVEVFHGGRAITTRWYAAAPGAPVLHVAAQGGARCTATLWTVHDRAWLRTPDG